MKVGFKADYFVLNPVDPADVPNGALFIDSTNGNTMTIKDSGGAVGSIDSGGGTGIFLKQMEASGAISLNAPVSKRSDGKIEQADANAAQGQAVCGYAQAAASTNGDLITILCIGPNIVGALTGLGFTPGDEIYVSESGTYTNDPASLTDPNDSVIKVGIADCSAGVASNTVNDLIAFAQVVARP